MLALLAPGQGAQSPGFLTPWLDVPGVADRLAWLSRTAGTDLVTAGTTAGAAEIRDTAVAQPLLVGAAVAVGEGLLDTGPGVLAGHSVGEVAAAALGGVLSPEAALAFVRQRGLAMADASSVAPTGMSAVLGGDESTVIERLTALGLTAANRNGAGQIVAAGPLDALAALAADPPEGARVRPLSVAGAFHTEVMAPARDALAGLARGLLPRDPAVPLVSNADGALLRDGRTVLRRLVDQVAAPVRFDLCLHTLAALGVTATIELPPAGTLTALVRRELPGVHAVALRSPDDLATARSLAEVPATDHLPAWRVVVAPLGGTFRTAPIDPATPLPPGGVVGHLHGRRGVEPVAAAHGGLVVEWLAEDGDPVSPGQPLARLHPLAGA